ncbi:membrane protein [Photobacterium marinum]|uniref:Membrane protein n=2 Tax=Photobacterium marinum TaxID=1056511 RepID=L8JDG5_9GAMM|nr:membrane protein [Photobacterium marinum]
MGAADVVPGVSGGTIAFITGIYDKLLESIRRVNPSLIGIIKKDGLKAAFNHVNGTFLILLLSGILTSIFTLARFITWMLHNNPIPLWSFFFGLIIVSVNHMFKQVKQWKINRFVSVLAGAFFAYGITVLHPLNLEPTTFNILVAGSIAICAMILPGISGSFILLLLGMYSPILAAAKSVDIITLGTFATGCVIGLLTFSHLLSWVLRNYRDIALTFLTGLMLGTLTKIWPWKETLTWRINSSGEQVPLLERNLSPLTFEQVTGQPALLAYAIAAMIMGIALVWGLEKLADK